jgi:hypothetical protein
MILSTMIRREQGTYTTYDLSVIDQFNAAVRARAATLAGSVYFCDPANAIQPNRSVFAAGDDVHFTLQGDATVAEQMIQTLTP